MSEEKTVKPLEPDYFEPGSCWITDLNLLTDAALLKVSTTLDDMWCLIGVLREAISGTRIISFRLDLDKLTIIIDEFKKQAAMEWKRRQNEFSKSD